MSVLVAYASCYGATQGIAERIAQTLTSQGEPAEARSVDTVPDVGSYDAFVMGSAVYMFHWRKEATRFVKRNRATLAGKPVWLFSSGPLGTDKTDAAGRDVRSAGGPKELVEFMEATKAREHHVFFGAFKFGQLRGVHRAMVKALPALRKLLVEGDFRDWPEIDAWAVSIAQVLASTTQPERPATGAGAAAHEAA